MKKWEYKILDLDELMEYAPWNEKKMRDKKGVRWKTAFDNLGKEGWEFVMHNSGAEYGYKQETWVFKRELKKK